MNERIKELAIEANMIASEPNGFDPTGLTKSQQKFAELIVRECVEICLERHDSWKFDDESNSNSGPRDCAQMIEEHFGVEE